MSAEAKPAREFTGKHMLLVLLAFFGVIFAVNFTMAWLANSTWTGLVVKNSYVASQEFNAKAASAEAQIARGWTYDLAVADGRVGFTLTAPGGAPVTAKGVTVTFKRPVNDREDVTVALAPRAAGGWDAAHVLGEGAWIAVIDADVGESQPWRETLRFLVRDGKRT